MQKEILAMLNPYKYPETEFKAVLKCHRHS
jgi:hypothetical protein